MSFLKVQLHKFTDIQGVVKYLTPCFVISFVLLLTLSVLSQIQFVETPPCCFRG